MEMYDPVCKHTAYVFRSGRAWLIACAQKNCRSELRQFFGSAPPGTRTLDTLIKSQVLYQLS